MSQYAAAAPPDCSSDEARQHSPSPSSSAYSNYTCNHVKKCVDVNKARKGLQQLHLNNTNTNNTSNNDKERCAHCVGVNQSNNFNTTSVISNNQQSEDSLWVCLACGIVLCDSAGHSLQHFETPHSRPHALAARLQTQTSANQPQVRCHACKRALSAQQDRKLADCLQQLQQLLSHPRSSVSPSPSPPPPPPLLALPLPAPAPRPASASNSSNRVRGLSNLGNTCFFNSVLQCLVQTPYLLDVLRDISRPGELVTISGGKLTIPAPPPPKPEEEEERWDEEPVPEEEKPPEPEKEEPVDKEIELEPITGTLQGWGPLTETLADTLQELQTLGRGDVYNPSKLFNQFVSKFCLFAGGEQHDSHELLRHLLEAVRNEDLKRYRSVILEKFGLNNKDKRNDIDDETKLKVKFYGNQASDNILRPGQVFRGILVSTLECQDCKHSSHTTEHFLDLSLPIMADKPQPPNMTQRRKNREEQINCLGAAPENEKTKHQLKKEKQAARKQRKGKKGGHNNSLVKLEDPNQAIENGDNKSENKSSSEQSDADIEDNVDETPKLQENNYSEHRDNIVSNYHVESGYNSEKVISSDSIRASPVDLENKEKCDKSPERLDKDFDDRSFTTSIPLPYKPLNADSPQPSNPDSGVASPETAKHALSDVINADSPVTSKELGSPTSLSSENNMDMSSPRQSNNSPVGAEVENGTSCGPLEITEALQLKKITDFYDNKRYDNEKKYDPQLYNSRINYNSTQQNQSEEGDSSIRTSPDFETSKWNKDNSLSNRNFAVASRNSYEEGEYSVESCLNQFTSSELLTGNNKVGCDVCTKRANTGKTCYTNATKRFRISNLPAVLILHLKRFQIGARCMLRKISKHVNFPTVLDIAPFCSEDVRKMPNVSSSQNKILYSLYGVVEHSGNMHLGHYVAYVKVRPEVKPGDSRWSFLPKNKENSKDTPTTNGTCNDDTDSSLSGYESGEGAVGGSEVEPPSGKWYYVSDSQVSETTEEKVLKVTAYMLFYERIL